MDDGRRVSRGGGGFGTTFGVSFDGARLTANATAAALAGRGIGSPFPRFGRGSSIPLSWSFAVSFRVREERRKERCGRIGCGLTICLGGGRSKGSDEGFLATFLASIEPYLDSKSWTNELVAGIELSSL